MKCCFMSLIGILLAVVGILPPHSVQAADPAKTDKLWVYLGTYTNQKSKGIYRCELDLVTGKLSTPMLAVETPSPSFLAIHPNGRFLYAANEVGTFEGEKTGAVSAFAIDPKTGNLTLLNQQSSRGSGPCHLVVDRQGKNVLVANYGGGNIASLPIDSDGKLGKATSFVQHKGTSVDKRRQQAPHAHSINLDSANRFAFAADLGLDKVLIYRFDAAKGTLTPNDPPAASLAPGAGPRHFAFHPGGKYAYVINEMLCTVTGFAYDAERGALKEVQTITTLPHEVRKGYSTAEVVVHPSGKFLYGSNRGHDSIAIFTIEPKNGLLTAIGHEPTKGKMPRNFNIDPTGKYLLAANHATDNVVVFRIDPLTGKLSAVHEISAPTPVCVRFLAPPK